LAFIVSGSAAPLLFEIRWSRLLEKKVSRRTAELKKSEEKYRSLVESAEDFIFTVDNDGRFQSMASFTANFFGGHPDDFVGKHLAKVFPVPTAEKQLKIEIFRVSSDRPHVKGILQDDIDRINPEEPDTLPPPEPAVPVHEYKQPEGI
jgi:PAS domain-containing protein